MTRMYKRISNEKKIKLVIIIVTYNAKVFITDLLKSILNQDYDLRKALLAIIDNASIDGTLDEVLRVLTRSQNINYLVVSLDKNLGFTPANNLGLRIVEKLLSSLENRRVLLLNPDTKILSRNFFHTIEKISKRFPIVGFITLSGNDDLIDSIGAYVDYLGNAQDLLSGIKVTPNIQEFINLLPKLYYVPCTCFAAIVISGGTITSMGLLKNYYVMGFDDAEFCLRAWSREIPVIIYKEFMIWHARGGTQRATSLIKTDRQRTSNIFVDIPYHLSKNELLLAYEYLGPLRYFMRILLLSFIGIMLKRKHLAFSIIDSLRIVFKKSITRRRLPKGLIPRNPRTWVLLWTLKYKVSHPDRSLEEAMAYGTKRASFEYLKLRCIGRGLKGA